MEIIEIRIDYPSGMSITDRASYLADAGHVYPSERLQAVLREFCISEAPPVASAVIDGANVQLDSTTDGSFKRGETKADGSKRSLMAILLQPFLTPTKDQRQQIGRFLHALAAAACLGAVGVWHSTSVWTFAEIKLEASLVGAFVLTFVQGMIAIKGE
ncbi:hypothetical protein EN871_28950 [bacterium M00.F.Ca.ET.228.01.1.1]|nr:hypothetical protein EN871_28950 [bacterium M00.F.Ca.ET.228.01.1.1]TGR96486.1 hypothetical protein EN834_28000 [bacterium M00.F.Ca.ET.191.01.1.1]TGT97722.1 hypothetical protein EN798_28005 [bacterium M00.F.Ca.ET.155.01.1.1]